MPLDRRKFLHTGAVALGAAALTGPLAPGAAARPTDASGGRDGAATGTRPAVLPMYPEVGRGTAVLDHKALLGDVVEADWYEANIPFVDLPDQESRDTYYYRWRVIKHALKYTGPQEGWILSEFLGPVGYSAPNGGIVAAAAHHVREGRWLRDSRYLDDYIDYWLRGSGAGPKPATDFLNKNTTDWAHQYSFWIADAVVARASTDGRWDFATDRLPELQRQWRTWAPQYDGELGLYWQTPVWDAMEYTASSYQSDDPYHGGDGFRPTLNAYQYGDAKAIATLLRRRGEPGDSRQADWYDERANALRANQERWLWDEKDQFYKHVMRDANPDRRRIADREQIGFVPWYFHMAPAKNAAAWAQLTDPQGFAAPLGRREPGAPSERSGTRAARHLPGPAPPATGQGRRRPGQRGAQRSPGGERHPHLPPGQPRQGDRRSGPAHRHTVLPLDELRQSQRRGPAHGGPRCRRPAVRPADLVLRRRRGRPHARLL